MQLVLDDIQSEVIMPYEISMPTAFGANNFSQKIVFTSREVCDRMLKRNYNAVMCTFVGMVAQFCERLGMLTRGFVLGDYGWLLLNPDVAQSCLHKL